MNDSAQITMVLGVAAMFGSVVADYAARRRGRPQPAGSEPAFWAGAIMWVGAMMVLLGVAR